MPKQLVDLPIEAGIYTEQTARGAVGRWKDGDKVRFRYGLAEKIGGWSQIPTAFIGLARKLWDWSSLDTRKWVALGTEAKLYLYQAATYFDITPLRRTQARVDPIDTTNMSDLVDITDASHGAQPNDYVRISGASPVGGITIDGQYQIISITDVDTYVIQDDQTATSTANGGGTVTFNYDISVGTSNTTFGTGWGTGTWSQETWNTARTVSTTIELLRTWSLDNWGEDLIAVPRGGAMYHWDRNTGSNARAVVLPNAPQNVNYMIISQRDRHLFALGCSDAFTEQFDPLLIRWCSVEDFNDWVPTSTNTAGDLRLYRGSAIQAAIRTRGEILIFTDVSVHQINFLGGTSVYGLSTVGENVSILSPNAAIEVDYRVFFMAEADFYIYDGILRTLPSGVRNRVYDNLTVAQKQKVFAGLNREFNEIWFFYPAKDEDVFWETDFTLGVDADNYTKLDAANAVNYDVTFDASIPAVEISVNLTTTDMQPAYLRTDGAAVVRDATKFDVQGKVALPNITDNNIVGLAINVIDPSGNNDESWLMGGIDPTGSTFNIDRLAPGAALVDFLVSTTFASLSPPITLVADHEFTFTLIRNGSNLQLNVYDETNDNFYSNVVSYTLTAQDLLDFSGGTYGWVAHNLQSTHAPREIYTHAVGELGSLSTNQGTASVSREVNSYALYNYEEETWALGKLERTAWADRSPVFEKPYAAGLDQVLFKHETGVDDDGAALPSFIESYDMEIPEAGDYLMHVDRLIPDFIDLAGSVDLTLKAKKYPQVETYTVKGPYTVTPNTTKVSTRVRGRQIALRVSSDDLGDNWRMGTMRARIAAHGKRS